MAKTDSPSGNFSSQETKTGKSEFENRSLLVKQRKTASQGVQGKLITSKSATDTKVTFADEVKHKHILQTRSLDSKRRSPYGTFVGRVKPGTTLRSALYIHNRFILLDPAVGANHSTVADANHAKAEQQTLGESELSVSPASNAREKLNGSEQTTIQETSLVLADDACFSRSFRADYTNTEDESVTESESARKLTTNQLIVLDDTGAKAWQANSDSANLETSQAQQQQQHPLCIIDTDQFHDYPLPGNIENDASLADDTENVPLSERQQEECSSATAASSEIAIPQSPQATTSNNSSRSVSREGQWKRKSLKNGGSTSHHYYPLMESLDAPSITMDPPAIEVIVDDYDADISAQGRRERAMRTPRAVWQKLSSVLQDNRMKERDEWDAVLQAGSGHEHHILKRILNASFLTIGISLLLGVIVVIIYTSVVPDPSKDDGNDAADNPGLQYPHKYNNNSSREGSLIERSFRNARKPRYNFRLQ